jgi:hypothetical protein
MVFTPNPTTATTTTTITTINHFSLFRPPTKSLVPQLLS